MVCGLLSRPAVLCDEDFPRGRTRDLFPIRDILDPYASRPFCGTHGKRDLNLLLGKRDVNLLLGTMHMQAQTPSHAWQSHNDENMHTVTLPCSEHNRHWGPSFVLHSAPVRCLFRALRLTSLKHLQITPS